MARMMSSFGLPGGALTFANMNPAAQLGLVGVRRAAGTRRRKASTKRKARSARRKGVSVKRGKVYRTKPARLVKGSAEAKRYMASIRRKRKRR